MDASSVVTFCKDETEEERREIIAVCRHWLPLTFPHLMGPHTPTHGLCKKPNAPTTGFGCDALWHAPLMAPTRYPSCCRHRNEEDDDGNFFGF